MINLVSGGPTMVVLDQQHLDLALTTILSTGKCGQKSCAEPSTATELLGSAWLKIHTINTISTATQG